MALLEGVGMREGGGGGGPGGSGCGAGASEMGCARGQRERRATPLRDVVTVVNVLRFVDCVVFIMQCYWNSSEKWN